MEMSSKIRTYTGRLYDVLYPRPQDICIEDIAHHLSMTCRYQGAVHRFYSVAEHSVLVSYMVPKKYAFYGLMHDAQEAYVGDMPTPLKRNMPEFQEIEDRNWKAVAIEFVLPIALPFEVKAADSAIVKYERYALGLSKEEATGDVFIAGLNPTEAEALFLKRYNELL